MTPPPPHRDRRRLRRHALAATLIALGLGAGTGCANPEDLDPSSDEGAPALMVDFPVRGAQLAGSKVLVSGTARDEEGDVVRVVVGSTELSVGGSGHFEHELELEPGIHLIETSAVDAAGNEARDVRAVLVGELVPAHEGAIDSVAAHLSQPALDQIGEAVAVVLRGIDFAAMLAAQNPIYKKGSGCFRISVDVEDVTYQSLTVKPTAIDGALRVEVTLEDVHADLLGDYRISCLGGKRPMDVDADVVTVAGNLVLEVMDREVVARLEDAEVTHQGLRTRVGIVGLDQLADALDSTIVDKFSGTLLDQLDGALAQAVDQAVNRSYTQTIDGIDFGYRLWPRAFEADRDGLAVIVDIEAWTDLLKEVPYLATPTERPVGWKQGDELRAMIADDALTHILSVLWNAGLLRRNLPAEELGLQIPGITRIELKPLLPPVARSTGDTLQVVIGDMLVLLYTDAGGQEELALTLAVTAQLDVAATAPDGVIGVDLAIAELDINLLEERPIASEILVVDSVIALAEAGLTVAVKKAEKILALELPGLFGLSLRDLELSSEPGHALMRGALEPDLAPPQ